MAGPLMERLREDMVGELSGRGEKQFAQRLNKVERNEKADACSESKRWRPSSELAGKLRKAWKGGEAGGKKRDAPYFGCVPRRKRRC